MDVDDEQNGDGHAYPSPEQLPSPVVATIGPAVGTQVDKVSELTAETTFLDLTDDSSTTTVLLQCEFSPRDPQVLAAVGTDALARKWTFSRTATDLDPQTGRLTPHHDNLLDDGVSSNTTATGLSWSSDGALVAVASEPMDSEQARVEVWTAEGNSLATFEAFESPVICLRWNLSNTLLLAISPEQSSPQISGCIITVMFPPRQELVQFSLPQHSLMEQPLDVAWTSNEEFVICGGDTLQTFQFVDGVISPARKYETRDGHALSKITYDWRSGLLATASDTGIIDVS